MSSAGRKPVIIESPFAGDIEENFMYLQRCIRHAIYCDRMPLASHQMYTMALDDSVPIERDLGISVGFDFKQLADEVWVYIDRGISRGMRYGIRDAESRGCKIVFTSLDDRFLRGRDDMKAIINEGKHRVVFATHLIPGLCGLARFALPHSLAAKSRKIGTILT